MHRVRGDVLATGIGVQAEVFLQQRFMFSGPRLEVIVPRDHPGVLPQVQAELPVPRARQHLVLHSHLHLERGETPDRKSTRLNSSHGYISYAVFCLKKKKTTLSQ